MNECNCRAGKRKREDDDGDASMGGDDEDSRSAPAVKVEPPKGTEGIHQLDSSLVCAAEL